MTHPVERSRAAGPANGAGEVPPRRRSAGGEFAAGVGTLFRGFGLWRRRPDLALLGLVPAVIVAAALTTTIVLVIAFGPVIGAALTPFADDWAAFARDGLRVILVASLVLGLLAGSVLAFMAITLVVGDPFYARVWRAVEEEADPGIRLVEPPFWRTAGDAAVLLLRGLMVAVLTFAIGLIPVVGAIAAIGIGVLLNGRNLALELTARPLEARGFDRRARRAILRRRRARTAGFGVATAVLFLVPGGAVLGMVPAVVGATDLARACLGGSPASDTMGG